jgi:CubicO group peptidase (beta-lactamase class C family)
LVALPAYAQELDGEARALAVVEAAISGQPDDLFEAFQTHFASATWERHDEAWWRGLAERLAGDAAGREVTDVDAPSPDRLVVVTRGDHPPVLSLSFEIQTEAPFALTTMGVEAGDRGPGPELPPLVLGEGDEALVAELDAWLAGLAGEDRFAGSVLVAENGEAVYARAFGLADRRWQIENTMDTRFDVGSINKDFTQVVIGQLMEEGKLTLDDTIADHLPDYPDSDVAAKATLRHLLRHRSGIPDVFNPRFFDTPRGRIRSTRDRFALFTGLPLEFEPGARQSYSNSGYIVLGAIIEKLEGEPYPDVVQRRVFDRAGMDRSGFFDRDMPVPDVACGYTRRVEDGSEGPLRSNVFMVEPRGSADGGALCTAADLLRFDTALREHVLLSPAATAWFFGRTKVESGLDAVDPGVVSTDRATEAVGLAGGAPGLNSVIESEGRTAVIVLSNLDPPSAESVGIAISRALARRGGGS